MAAKGIQTSTQVAYNDNVSAKRLILETDSDPSLPKIKGATYVRVFPTYAGPSLTAVMGSATRLASGIPEDVTDYVSFSGSSSSSLRYPPSSRVIIKKARFLRGNPAVAYDAESSSLVLDREAHGIVEVAYRAYFDRYLVTHGDAPCLLASQQTNGLEYLEVGKKEAPNYEPSFIVAEADGWATASMEISGPPCSQSDDTNASKPYSDYTPIGLKIETDVAMPPALYPEYFDSVGKGGFDIKPQTVPIGGQATLLYCGCRIRVYPKTGITLLGVNCSVGSASVGSGSKPVIQGLTFSGSFAVNLDYPPSGRVSLAGTSSNAVSLFGDNVSVQFIGPGGWCNEAVWKTRTTYEVVQSNRRVREDEVVAASSLGSVTLPCYTFAQAQYSSDYYLYEVLFHWDEQIQWYAPAMVLAIDGSGKVGYLAIEPPGKGGVL